MLIKVGLIASVVALGVWLLRGEQRGNRLALTRLFGLAVTAAWVAAVLWPDTLTWVAHRVGVTRGADLLLYTLVVVVAFGALYQSKRVRHLERQIAELARSQALLEPYDAERRVSG